MFAKRGQIKQYLCHGDALDEQPGGGFGARRAQELRQGVFAPLIACGLAVEACADRTQMISHDAAVETTAVVPVRYGCMTSYRY